MQYSLSNEKCICSHIALERWIMVSTYSAQEYVTPVFRTALNQYHAQHNLHVRRAHIEH